VSLPYSQQEFLPRNYTVTLHGLCNPGEIDYYLLLLHGLGKPDYIEFALFVSSARAGFYVLQAKTGKTFLERYED
jgi:hypothetical protein